MIAKCYLILYRILVLAVHQLLVYQLLFRRRTGGVDSNRRLLDSEPAVRVLHPQIPERITVQHLQHVRGVTFQIFKTLEIPSISWREVPANLPFHVRDLLFSTWSNRFKSTENFDSAKSRLFWSASLCSCKSAVVFTSLNHQYRWSYISLLTTLV